MARNETKKSDSRHCRKSKGPPAMDPDRSRQHLRTECARPIADDRRADAGRPLSWCASASSPSPMCRARLSTWSMCRPRARRWTACCRSPRSAAGLRDRSRLRRRPHRHRGRPPRCARARRRSRSGAHPGRRAQRATCRRDRPRHFPAAEPVRDRPFGSDRADDVSAAEHQCEAAAENPEPAPRHARRLARFHDGRLEARPDRDGELAHPFLGGAGARRRHLAGAQRQSGFLDRDRAELSGVQGHGDGRRPHAAAAKHETARHRDRVHVDVTGRPRRLSRQCQRRQDAGHRRRRRDLERDAGREPLRPQPAISTLP